MKTPVTVTITGAAKVLGYALAFRVASGQMFGPDQPVNLHLLEISQARARRCRAWSWSWTIVRFRRSTKWWRRMMRKRLQGLSCRDAGRCGPRGPGMERKDCCWQAQIFSAQGKALDAVAGRDVKVLVVGNPANTNALIAQRNATLPCLATASPP